jgi:flagellar M-ring protein FliF
MARNDLTVTDGEDIDNEAIEINKRSPLDILKNGEIARSIIIILCLAIFLVVGLVIIFWAKEPVLRPLGQYSDTNELNAVMAYLKQNEYDYRFYDLKDGKQNVISVNVEDYDRIVEGLTVNGVIDTSPKDGSEILLGDSSFGVSARKEEERLKYAREQQISNML